MTTPKQSDEQHQEVATSEEFYIHSVNSDETRIIEQNPALHETILHRARHPGDWVDAEDILNRS